MLDCSGALCHRCTPPHSMLHPKHPFNPHASVHSFVTDASLRTAPGSDEPGSMTKRDNECVGWAGCFRLGVSFGPSRLIDRRPTDDGPNDRDVLDPVRAYRV